MKGIVECVICSDSTPAPLLASARVGGADAEDILRKIRASVPGLGSSCAIWLGSGVLQALLEALAIQYGVVFSARKTVGSEAVFVGPQHSCFTMSRFAFAGRIMVAEEGVEFLADAPPGRACLIFKA